MKKKLTTLLVILLTACMMLSGCAGKEGSKSENSPAETVKEPAKQEAKSRNADGYYEWDVRGITLRTKANIMDYIQGNVWDPKPFMKEHGWTDRFEKETEEGNFFGTVFALNNPKDPYIRFGNASISFLSDHAVDDQNVAYNPTKYVFYGICYYFIDQKTQHVIVADEVMNSRQLCDYYIKGKDNKITLPFELIVYFTYICEQLEEYPDTNPLEALPLQKNGSWYTI